MLRLGLVQAFWFLYISMKLLISKCILMNNNVYSEGPSKGILYSLVNYSILVMENHDCDFGRKRLGPNLSFGVFFFLCQEQVWVLFQCDVHISVTSHCLDFPIETNR